MTQRRRGYFDRDMQRKVESGELAPMEPDFILRGGCTLLVDLETARVRYCIYKDLSSQNRMERMRRYLQEGPVRLCRPHIWETLVENIFNTSGKQGLGLEPLANLHQGEQM